MNYQDMNTDKVKSYRTIKGENLNVSLPKDGTETMMDIWHVIAITPKPTYNQYLEKAVELAPVAYTQVWEIQALDQVTIEANIVKAQEAKTTKCEAYAQTQIDNAYANPTNGVTDTVEHSKRRVNARIKYMSAKVSGEVALTQLEKDQAKLDQKLSEHESKLWGDSDKAIANMMKLNTATEIYAFDISLETWTVWAPPA